MKIHLFLLLLLSGLVFAVQVDLEELRDLANKNTDAIPLPVRQIFGNERINLYLEDQVVGVITKNAQIIEMGPALLDPTLNAYTDSDTVKAMLAGELSFSKALQTGKLRYEAVDTITKIKTIIAEFARAVFSILSPPGGFSSVIEKTPQSTTSQAVEYSCSDNEGGQSEMWAGNITLNDSTGRVQLIPDSCLNETVVEEYYCAPRDSGAGTLHSFIACPDKYNCVRGECKPRPPRFTCNDEGLNIWQKTNSTVLNEDGEVFDWRVDECVDATRLSEKICVNSTSQYVSSVVLICPFGFECADGTCIESQQVQYRCFDSDNGGDEFTVGTATVRASNATIVQSLTDQCTNGYPPNGRTLIEARCVASPPNSIGRDSIQCDCLSGACARRSKVCSESDGRIDVHIASTTSNSSGSSGRDSCEGENAVREYYCVDGQVFNGVWPCASGERCVDGACRPREGVSSRMFTCADSDAGTNEFIAGNVTVHYTNGTIAAFVDSCFNEEIAVDYACPHSYNFDSVVSSTNVACGPGGACRNGACIAG